MLARAPGTVTAVAAASAPVPTIIRLRAPVRRVEWGGGVIDNEGMGKKSSKSTAPGVSPCVPQGCTAVYRVDIVPLMPLVNLMQRRERVVASIFRFALMALVPVSPLRDPFPAFVCDGEAHCECVSVCVLARVRPSPSLQSVASTTSPVRLERAPARPGQALTPIPTPVRVAQHGPPLPSAATSTTSPIVATTAIVTVITGRRVAAPSPPLGRQGSTLLPVTMARG